MITKIQSNKAPNFSGTTIIKQEGGLILTKEIINAVDSSTHGFCTTRLGGYSLVVVSDVFKKEESNFLKSLKEKGFEYVNFSKIFNYKESSIKELLKLVENIKKIGLL